MNTIAVVKNSSFHDTTKVINSNRHELAMDEAIKCKRSELLDFEFVGIGEPKVGDFLRITFQDLERGGREILMEKKLKPGEEFKFYMPQETVKEATMAVLIVYKGTGMFFKKIDLSDEN